MGCYGIGLTRLIAAAVEVLSKDQDLRWPEYLAPHQICIISQKVCAAQMKGGIQCRSVVAYCAHASPCLPIF